MNEPTPEVRAMRVAIAKDAIAQLDGPTPPIYNRQAFYFFADVHGHVDREDDLQQYLDRFDGPCQVCELGSLLLSKARLYDNAKVGEMKTLSRDNRLVASRCDVEERLADVFDPGTLDLLESAFEREVMGRTALYTARLAARGYGLSLGDEPEEAARAIFRNLIDNDGTFVIPAEFLEAATLEVTA